MDLLARCLVELLLDVGMICWLDVRWIYLLDFLWICWPDIRWICKLDVRYYMYISNQETLWSDISEVNNVAYLPITEKLRK